jgi:1-deoxy-D-xylulose-5-phosphate reductoisomerase|tara:strand:+ start:153 stop:1319 length:1167 start_codon:yes stop_codon:yes gene_type:complete
MKKKVAILGSTGSIGKTTLEIIRKDKKNFQIELLTANNNVNELIKQAKEFKVKNLLIHNKKKNLLLIKKLKNKNIKIFYNLEQIENFFKKKIDYTMCSISGLEGLKPTLSAIKFSKKIAIANKESIICGWNLIIKKLKKYKTEFLPIDSEHFSINELLNKKNILNIEEIILTASGGPFLKLPYKNYKKITIKSALKHPNWSMGKKITIDSSTLMNKVFEVIEAKKIFNVSIDKIKILIHPKSYIHAIVKFNNGLTKILIHDTNMTIPIFNSLNSNKSIPLKTKLLDIDKLNNLELSTVNTQKFPSVKILKRLPLKDSLYETVIVSANDELVEMFLEKKIKFLEIIHRLNKIINLKEFIKYKKITPKNLSQIYKLSKIVRLKTRSLSIV